MNSLARYENNGIELLINTETGESFATQGMIAKICNQESSTIRYFLNKTGVENTAKLLPVKDSRGVEQLSKVYDESVIFDVIANYNPELLKNCAKVGLRVYLHKLAGFEVISTAVTESKALPTAVEYANALIGLESLQDSLLKQLIKDSMIDELELQRNCKMLSNKNSKLSYTTVKVRAKQLGFSERDIKNGAELGKYVKKRIKPVLQEMIGRYPTYHYEINNELDHAIINFFKSQNIFPSK